MNFGVKHTWLSHFRCVPVKCVTLDKLLNLSDLQLCHLKVKEKKQIIEGGCKNKETNACAGLCTDLAQNKERANVAYHHLSSSSRLYLISKEICQHEKE